MELMVLYLFLLSGFFFFFLGIHRDSDILKLIGGSVFLLAGLSLFSGIEIESGTSATANNTVANITTTETTIQYQTIDTAAIRGFGLLIVICFLYLVADTFFIKQSWTKEKQEYHDERTE